MAQQIDAAELQRVEERDSVACHLGHGARHFPRGEADTGVVEQDHLALGRDLVNEQRVPVLQIAAKVLEEDDRWPALSDLAEASVRVRDPVLGIN